MQQPSRSGFCEWSSPPIGAGILLASTMDHRPGLFVSFIANCRFRFGRLHSTLLNVHTANHLLLMIIIELWNLCDGFSASLRNEFHFHSTAFQCDAMATHNDPGNDQAICTDWIATLCRLDEGSFSPESQKWFAICLWERHKGAAHWTRPWNLGF